MCEEVRGGRGKARMRGEERMRGKKEKEKKEGSKGEKVMIPLTPAGVWPRQF